jgi:hypothetical protein
VGIWQGSRSFSRKKKFDRFSKISTSIYGEIEHKYVVFLLYKNVEKKEQKKGTINFLIKNEI